MAPVIAKPTREELLFIAELAGEADRHEDAVRQVKTIVEYFGAKLLIEERNILSIAYKSITNALRNSWRAVDALHKLQLARSPGRTKQLLLIRRQREKIEQELTNVCKDVMLLLDQKLIPTARNGEETVFFVKMKGDYCRYLAEFCQKQDFGELSLNAYKLAYKHALATLHPLHPTRLGLALNFSVFYHDVYKSPERACHLAKSAFDDAVLSVDPSDPASDQAVRDSMAILQLLRDDLMLWSGEIKDEN